MMTTIEGALASLPLWALFVATVAIVLLSIEGGYQLGSRRRQRSDQEKETPVGAVVGAMLGLLAFMLAFTFGLAATRFDARRMAVLEEDNAIVTTYQRAGLVEEPYRSQTRSILREYVDMRVAGVHRGTYEQTIARSEELQRQLWAQAEVLGRKRPRESIVGLFIQSLNGLMDLHAKRVMLVTRNHIPGSIWMALYLISSLAMGGMGYHAGLSGSKRSPIILSLALTFSLIILLIADLDLPQKGLLDVNEQSMIDVRNMMVAPDDPEKAPRRPGVDRTSGQRHDKVSPPIRETTAPQPRLLH